MLAIALVLVICSALLVWAEIWIPSFGLLTAAAIGCLIGAFIFAAQSNVENAITITGLTSAVILPLSILFAIKLIEHSPLLLKEELTSSVGDEERIAILKDLIGKTGLSHTDLRPSGSALIDDKKYDVVALSGYIDKGKTIRVVKVEGIVVTVSLADAGALSS